MITRQRVFTAPPVALDRCDGTDCEAKALVAVKFKTGDLVFCGHHYDKLPSSFLELMLGVCDTRID